ncbi:hypothetical protein MKX08_004901 [Trichoderma sp. CBMAI-0020]|nr:hypothetical protein MKX08_004901 [Trichoderma sp. CBMAI-0020]
MYREATLPVSDVDTTASELGDPTIQEPRDPDNGQVRKICQGPLQALKQCGNAGVQRVWMVDAALDFGAWPPTQATAQAVQRICVE